MAASRPSGALDGALDRVPRRLLDELLDAVRAGATTPAEAVGFGPGELGAVEQAALGLYRGGRHAEAALLYGFVLRLDARRTSAWRGLGACAQAAGGLGAAAACYDRALEADPRDNVSKVLLGEVLCLVGDRDRGRALVAQVAAARVSDPVEAPYAARARAILHARDGTPARLVITGSGEGEPVAPRERSSEVPTDAAPAAARPSAVPFTTYGILADPSLRPALDTVREGLASGTLTLAQVGGFTTRELDAAYAVACRHVELGRLLEAMQIAGFLMFLDPRSARYPRLVGICLQRMKQYGPADYLYGLALALDGDDPMTLVYRGETRVMAGQVEAGLELVRRGIEAAGGAGEHRAVVDRGRALLERFGRRQPATVDAGGVSTSGPRAEERHELDPR